MKFSKHYLSTPETPQCCGTRNCSVLSVYDHKHAAHLPNSNEGEDDHSDRPRLQATPRSSSKACSVYFTDRRKSSDHGVNYDLPPYLKTSTMHLISILILCCFPLLPPLFQNINNQQRVQLELPYLRQSDAGRRRKLIQGGEKTEERQDGQHGRYLAAVVLVLFPPAAEPAAKAPPPAAADRPVHDRQPHQLCAHR